MDFLILTQVLAKVSNGQAKTRVFLCFFIKKWCINNVYNKLLYGSCQTISCV